MTNFEGHPLHPGEGLGLFIGPGIIKTPAQMEPFYEMDPNVLSALWLGGFTGPDWAGNAAMKGGNDFTYDRARGAAGNARGLPNPGKEGIRALKEPIRILSETGIKTVIQVTNLPHETPKEVIPELVALAAEQNPTAVEVNLSCPNGLDAEGNLHPPLSDNPEACAEVMALSRDQVGSDVCLGAKDSPHVTGPGQLPSYEVVADLVDHVDNYIDFFSGINTIGGQDFPEITCANGKGGMSGPIVAPIAREHLLHVREANPLLAYISIGGVDLYNIHHELRWRRERGAVLVGGSQEFYRATRPERLAARWAIAVA